MLASGGGSRNTLRQFAGQIHNSTSLRELAAHEDELRSQMTERCQTMGAAISDFHFNDLHTLKQKKREFRRQERAPPVPIGTAQRSISQPQLPTSFGSHVQHTDGLQELEALD